MIIWPESLASAYVFDGKDVLLGWVTACEDRGYRVTVLGQGDRLDRYGETEILGVAARFPAAASIEVGGDMVDLPWEAFTGNRRPRAPRPRVPRPAPLPSRERDEAAGEKRCRICEAVLPLTAFRLRTGGYSQSYTTWCKPCEAASKKEYYLMHKKKETA